MSNKSASIFLPFTLLVSAASAQTPVDIGVIDLSKYVRVGRYDLPEPTRTALPAGTPSSNLLAQEASAVTYDWDTDTLFVVGDGGRGIVQVSKTGQLIDTMTLALGSSPQGTEFYDTEGITYIGGGQFVFTEERDRQLVKFTYVAGTTLTRAQTQTVKLGTFVDNIGLEGVTWDPQSGGYICVKEVSPEGIFQTDIDWDNGTATNGSPSTQNSINLFDPSLLGVSDFADIFSLSIIPGMAGKAQADHLLVLSQASARIVNTDRLGNVASTLQIVADAGSPLSAADEQHEGIGMDRNGVIYIANENGGGDSNHPQLWVYAPSTVPNQAPTAVTVAHAVTSLAENVSTAAGVKLGDIVITDDGQGVNTLSLSGADASFFEITDSSLYLKPGVALDFETKNTYNVTISAIDTTVGAQAGASVNFTLNVTDVAEGGSTGTVFISEINPTGSSNGTYNADWFEVTNPSSSDVNITGWTMDDNSNGSGKVALRGLTVIPAGKSAIFFEGTSDGSTDATIIANFCTAWFGTATPPTGFLWGAYGGSGVGLSSGGDAVNLFDASGNRVTGVAFGTSTSHVTFQNQAAIGSATLPLPIVSDISVKGLHGAFVSANGGETGSPGRTGAILITEVAPWSSGSSVGSDWFEVTNTSAFAVDMTGWKMDDNSQSPAAAVALNGIASIAPGESVVYLETSTPDSTFAAFLTNWFGANPPAGLHLGSYSGSGVGLSTGGDQVNLYDPTNTLRANVAFGASPSGPALATFDNSAGVNGTISQLSVAGTAGAFIARNASGQTGSPGSVVNGPLNFANWQSIHGFTSGGFAADSNHSGIPDGVKMFFNLNPANPGDRGNLPALSFNGTDKLLSYATLDQAAGVTGVLETSADLNTWKPAVAGTDYEVVTSVSASGQTTTTLRLLGASAQLFWRYSVSEGS